MNKTWIEQTRKFIARASIFILITALLDYLVIFSINLFTDNYVIELFDAKILLIVAVVSGFTYVLAKD
jgi:hypothetical protein